MPKRHRLQQSRPRIAAALLALALAGCSEEPPPYRSPAGFQPIVIRATDDTEFALVHVEKRDKPYVVSVSKAGRAYSEWMTECEMGRILPIRTWNEGDTLPPIVPNLDWRKLARGADETAFAYQACKAMGLGDLLKWRELFGEAVAKVKEPATSAF